jgi:hypothetical protein
METLFPGTEHEMRSLYSMDRDELGESGSEPRPSR